MSGRRGMLSAVEPSADRQREFVLRHTRVRPVPLLPELRLRQADEIVPLWEQTERELGTSGSDAPFWAFAWVGGQAVARYVLDHPAEVVGRTVVDLAAGCGLGAIAAARAGAAAVLAADIGSFACAAVALNAEANGVRVGFTGADLLASDPPLVDVVLVGDACYERRMTVRVLGWLRAARERGARVLLGDPGRAYLPGDGLTRLAEYTVATTVDLEGVAVRRAAVYALTAGRAPRPPSPADGAPGRPGPG
jgi:predicted nicotinamide N-methyase